LKIFMFLKVKDDFGVFFVYYLFSWRALIFSFKVWMQWVKIFVRLGLFLLTIERKRPWLRLLFKNRNHLFVVRICLLALNCVIKFHYVFSVFWVRHNLLDVLTIAVFNWFILRNLLKVLSIWGWVHVFRVCMLFAY
jgi:hypothetical protein